MSKESKSSAAQIAAHKRYDAKRSGLQIAVRMSENEIRALDNERGDESRSAYVLKVLRKALKIK